ncbi:MAG: ribonuclease HI [Gemmataceae bacterium]
MAQSNLSQRKQVEIYTDGAAVPNPGSGGYGVVLKFGKHRKELSGGFLHTTNNRMELMAAIVGLEALKETCKVTLYSDSQYLVNSMSQGNVVRWKTRGWRLLSNGKYVKNPDLWERLLAACEDQEVRFVWVRGHSGNVENERCDRLALVALRGTSLDEDVGYLEPVVTGTSEMELAFGDE